MFLQFQPDPHLITPSVDEIHHLRSHLFGKVQVIAEPLASEDLVYRETRVAVSQGQEEVPACNDDDNDNEASNPCAEHALAGEPLPGSDVVSGAGNRLLVLGVFDDFVDGLRVKDEFEESTGNQAGCEMSWKIMMQEKLTSHEVEWEIVSGPGQEEESG